ncbi:hybrid sensor histidine kinase/response regulator [Geobacter sp. DSM 9736]|uniref:hybrid sensor histidine kinase/response regulator n=1 Tax=Geobacter sp. DSM 9736 TaxID=1277350 RepID=UPI000B50E877|nr:hybrid sensor histidine kinase/response regulator [Geobacter sp. DSM 9736]SNB47684.1 two-component system, chemotaxis family, sensor kinase CheA [Geobacter sp. DSM 9736]
MDPKYLDIFLKEAEEHLSMLQKGLLVLEKEPENVDLIHGLLRNAHTLKGSARMMGLDSISAVAHRMEDLLKEVEEGERSVDSSVVDLLLRGTDAVTHLTRGLAAGEYPEIDVDEVFASSRAGGISLQDIPRQEGLAEADTVRARVKTLDSLVNLVGEMIINRTRFDEKLARLRALCRSNNETLPTAALAEFTRDLEMDVLYHSYLLQELHGEAMALRMLPLRTVTDVLERLVRDQAKAQGKEILFEIVGDDIELDRVMLDILKPVFIHVISNAVDHGIETPDERIASGKRPQGTVRLTARHEGNRVRIDIFDDGRGINLHRVRQVAIRKGVLAKEEADQLGDEEALDLILRPGFSTSELVTDVSGRGMGMDVARRNIDSVKGTLSLTSEPGCQTLVTLHLPLTLSVLDALVVSSGDERYAIPLNHVQETIRVRDEDIDTVGTKEVVTVRGKTVPLVSLATLLGLGERKTLLSAGRLPVVVLKQRDQLLACSIDETWGSSEVVVKSLGKQLRVVECVSGATILGDGNPALILNVSDLFARAEGAAATSFRREFEERAAEQHRGSILVVDDSITTRTMERSILVANGYSVEVAVSGEDALGKVGGTTFDLVVTDIEMPGIDGFELTKRLRMMNAYAQVPVIVVSSRSRDEDKRRALEAGAQAYIVKGTFDQGVLLDTVEALIG